MGAIGRGYQAIRDTTQRLLGKARGAIAGPPAPRSLSEVVGSVSNAGEIVWCLDSASCAWGGLALRGWLLHGTKKIDAYDLFATLPSGERHMLDITKGTPRDSLVGAFPASPDAAHCGFVGITDLGDVDFVTVEARVIIEGQLYAWVMGTCQNMRAVCPPEERDGVLVVCEGPRTASRRYRGDHLVEQLNKQGVRAALTRIEDLDDQSATYRHLVLQRSYLNPQFPRLIDYARQAGCALFEVDDALVTFELRMQNDHLRHYPEQQCFDTQRMREVIASCDALITTTEPLVQLLEREFSPKPVLLSPNVASDEMLALSNKALEKRRVRAKQDDVVRLGYFSGSATHNGDFGTIINPLIKTLDTCPNARLSLVGEISAEGGPLDAYEERIDYCESVDWHSLPELIAGVDINLIPLEITRFNECKSAIKWMEAALVGVPTVATRNRELARVIDDGTTGLLCSNEDEWSQALISLVRGAKLRARIANAARNEARAHYTTSQISEELLALLRETPGHGDGDGASQN